MIAEVRSSPHLRYRPELDGIRAVAVVLVVVHHVLQPHRFAGFVGVDVFFVLSGYLITTILLAEYGRSGSLRFGVFYARRFLRLYPALLTMLLLTFPLYGLMDVGGGLAVQAKRSLVAATYTGNLYMTYRHQWLGPETHTWSLALEEQYYLVWPVVLVVAIRIGLKRFALVGVLVAAAVGASVLSVRDFSFGNSVFPVSSTCGGLLLGSALAVLLALSPAALRACAPPAVATLGVLVMLGVLIGFSVTSVVPDGAYVVAAEVATVLIVAQTTAARRAGALTRSLSMRPVAWLGRISYGVYLWHYPIVLLCVRQLPRWSPWARLPLVATAAVLLAWGSYSVVETPFLRWKNRIGRGTDDVGPAVPEPADARAAVLAGRRDRFAGPRR